MDYKKMKLLGFYISDYKGIVDQFINLSSKYRFNVSKTKDDKLDIEADLIENYIEGFFGDDIITDFSAIVSDGGVDKSVILEYIQDINNSDSLIVIEVDDNIVFVKNESDIIIKNDTEHYCYEVDELPNLYKNSTKTILCKDLDFEDPGDCSNVVLLIDDIIAGRHPQQQKAFVYNIIEKINNLFVGKDIQVIITTDSPFIISDFPKNHIVFLKSSNGNIVAFNKNNKKKETLGQNIHTIITDALFIDDGLIGDFGREKINKVISFINDDDKIKNSEMSDIDMIRKQINKIGEHFIMSKLNSMLQNQINAHLPNIKKKDVYQRRIDQLQSELDELNEKKNVK